MTGTTKTLLPLNEADTKRAALAITAYYTKNTPKLAKEVEPLVDAGFRLIASGDLEGFNRTFNQVTDLFAKANPKDVIIPGCSHHDALQTLRALRESLGTPN